MLASDARLAFVPLDEFCGGEADVWGDGDDMTPAAGPPFSRHTKTAGGLLGGSKDV
jgi:hypothetical protein